MSDEKEFHFLKGDISSLYVQAGYSAQVLNKIGADKFDTVSEEAHFFLDAIHFHNSAIEYYSKQIISADEMLANQSKILGQFIGEGWRGDVMATVFEFNALLVCTRSLFDRLLQVLKTPLNMQLPKSINDLTKKPREYLDKPLLGLILSAWEEWGKDAKEYRDCLLHYSTFFEGMSYIHAAEGDKRELLIPDNPNANSRRQFKYEKKISVLQYSQEVSRKSMELAVLLFEQVFEQLITEEFGDTAKIIYWENLPSVDVNLIKGKHSIDLVPGLAYDKEGKNLRCKRTLEINDDGSFIVVTFPEEWTSNNQTGERGFSQEERYLASTEIPVALKKILDSQNSAQAPKI